MDLGAWTDSWTGVSDNPSAACAVSVMIRVICAGRKLGAGAVLLIIRRSWVRAPPAPPAVLLAVSAVPWTDVGGAIHPAVIAVRSHTVAVERVWRAKAYGGKDRTGCLPGSPRAYGTEQYVLP
jgi:hypothetical protein